MELVPPFVLPLVDRTRYFRHAPARLRVDANMFALACGYAAILPAGATVACLRPRWRVPCG